MQKLDESTILWLKKWAGTLNEGEASNFNEALNMDSVQKSGGVGVSNTVKVSNTRDGIGFVPNNDNVDYMGYRVKMIPSIFLKLAAPLDKDSAGSLEYIKGQLKGGGSIASPWLKLDVPSGWFRGEDFNTPAKVIGHEGRNRMYAVKDLYGDVPIEVHLFFYGEVRNRDVTEEWLSSLNRSLVSQTGERLYGSFFKV